MNAREVTETIQRQNRVSDVRGSGKPYAGVETTPPVAPTTQSPTALPNVETDSSRKIDIKNLAEEVDYEKKARAVKASTDLHSGGATSKTEESPVSRRRVRVEPTARASEQLSQLSDYEEARESRRKRVANPKPSLIKAREKLHSDKE